MANTGYKITDLSACSSPSASDKLLVSGNSDSNSFYLTVGTLFGNSSANISITTIATPANSTALTVRRGVVATDGNFLYIATANNFMKRVALTAF